jgi:hypothetical protein
MDNGNIEMGNAPFACNLFPQRRDLLQVARSQLAGKGKVLSLSILSLHQFKTKEQFNRFFEIK